MRFVYSVVRFVPSPARGEFINVGAIVGSEALGEWRSRRVSNASRAQRFDDHNTLPAVWDFLDDIDRQIREQEERNVAGSLFEGGLTEAWLGQLYDRHQNLVQLSPPCPMVATSAGDALERVFDAFIVDRELRVNDAPTKTKALKAMRAAYSELGLPKHRLAERVLLQSEEFGEVIDFAVVDGSAVQLAHAWSFQVNQQEVLRAQIKSWAWTVKTLRQSGGALVLAEDRIEVCRDVDVSVVCIPPTAGADSSALLEANSVFKQLSVGQTDLAGAREVAERAQRLLGVH